MSTNSMYAQMGVSDKVLAFGEKVLEDLRGQFSRIDAIAERSE